MWHLPLHAALLSLAPATSRRPQRLSAWVRAPPAPADYASLFQMHINQPASGTVSPCAKSTCLSFLHSRVHLPRCCWAPRPLALVECMQHLRQLTSLLRLAQPLSFRCPSCWLSAAACALLHMCQWSEARPSHCPVWVDAAPRLAYLSRSTAASSPRYLSVGCRGVAITAACHASASYCTPKLHPGQQPAGRCSTV